MREPTIKLIIHGEPKSQQRHRTHHVKCKDGREFDSRYDPSTKDKAAILAQVWDQRPDVPFTTAVRVDLNLYYPYRKEHYRSGRYSHLLKQPAPLCHIKQPDRDNADKIILDALSEHFWKNDSIVCDGRIRKMYSETPRTEITITLIEETTLFDPQN